MAISVQQPVWDRLYTHFSLPVLMKEMRVRMRGLRAPIILGIATALSIIVGLLIIMPGWDSISVNDTRSMVHVGENLFTGLIVLEGILCAVIAPALTAGAISIEREQQTLDLLLLTRLSDMNILFGKLLSALSFIAMILICTLPVVAISFLLGGVDPAELCWSVAIIFSTACFFSAIGLYCSTRYAKTSTAVAIAYCLCLASLALLPLLGGATAGFLDPTSTQTYYIFIGGASALFSLYPSVIGSALYILIRRRPVPWLVVLLCWIVFAAASAWLLLHYEKPIHTALNNHGEYVAVGNPVYAIILLIFGKNGGMPPPSPYINTFNPTTVGLLLFALLVTLVLTIGEFKRLRR